MMRLTLRTLLAYLDNTLEPADAEVLRLKIAESGFATQLVQKIRQKLADPDLLAPPPDSIHPVHDANVISEYLDSTLSHEQVAEIERACLEADESLSEAAACHQILTMVLGNRADVPPELRQRIYALPDRAIGTLAASSDRFSSISIQDAETQPGAGIGTATPQRSALDAMDDPQAEHDGLPAFAEADQQTPTEKHPVAPSGVKPVRISDSGVHDAPTRLRQSGVADADSGGLGNPSGSARRALYKEDQIYGGSIRPSRITPWLVSLAVVAALLLAMVQIFRPLLSGRSRDQIASTNNLPEISVNDSVDSRQDSEPSDAEARDADTSDADTSDVDSSDADSSVADSSVADSSAEEMNPATGGADALQDVVEPPAPTETDRVASLVPTQPDPSPAIGSSETEPAGDAVPVESNQQSADAAAPTVLAESLPSPPTDAVDRDQTIATVDGSDTLIAYRRDGESWRKCDAEASIQIGTDVLCLPTFRGQLRYAGFAADGQDAADAAVIQMIGTTRLGWAMEETERPRMQLDEGRLLITSKSPSLVLAMQLDQVPARVSFDEQETMIAVSVRSVRKPGSDPLRRDPVDDPSADALIGIAVVQGQVTIDNQQKTENLIAGQQWVKRGDAAVTVSPFLDPPDWVSPSESVAASLESSARTGLLEQIGQDDSLEMALREATLFRRSEVAALAARTLLQLGQGDVYFGGDGILNQAKQRQYWSEHYQALVRSVDRGPQSARSLRQSIAKMDAAGAEILYRLLVGYSEEQLVQGADQQLVSYLDSESMAVRVLALENLRQITGTTLFFRPENENRARRTPNIRKWLARQKKGDIRWSIQQ